MKKYSLKTGLAILLALILFPGNGFSQSTKTDKKFNKAKELASEGKTEKADEQLIELLKEFPDFGNGWDFLAKLRYKEYQESKLSDNLFGNNFTITTTDKDGNKIDQKDDTLGLKLRDLLTSIKPSKKAYNKYIYTLRKGTLLSNDARECSFTLRNIFIDPEVDTNVSKKALRYFDNAEEEFAKTNYGDAAKLYKRAIEEQPDFYKARLYLGDCYYYMGNYQNAITSFKEAINTFPKLIEPRKYLVDAYLKEKLYEEALDEAIKAVAVYPDNALMQRLDDAAYMNEKVVDSKWITREVFPNKIESDTAKADLNMYEDPDPLTPKAQWKYYSDAQEKIEDKCNEKGIILQSTPLTKSRYLEEYSWEEMLANSNDPSLDEARRMQAAGYLDCYVLITCYHIDIYDQYYDLVNQNPNKIKEYFNKYIIPKSVK